MKRYRLVRLLLLVIVGAIVAYHTYSGRETAPSAAVETIRAAYEEGRSGIMVEASGVVQRTLADDLEGSRHQRFIVRLPGGQTVLLSHNIDLAPRIPLGENDRVQFRGQYEWNERGGVVHWTHHDPRGRREGGWVEHRGERYR